MNHCEMHRASFRKVQENSPTAKHPVAYFLVTERRAPVGAGWRGRRRCWRQTAVHAPLPLLPDRCVCRQKKYKKVS